MYPMVMEAMLEICAVGLIVGYVCVLCAGETGQLERGAPREAPDRVFNSILGEENDPLPAHQSVSCFVSCSISFLFLRVCIVLKTYMYVCIWC